MTALILEQYNRQEVRKAMADNVWVVACLCAAWCDVCKAYQVNFDGWAARHPDKQFLWIDIEDHADLVGDLDVENFPTLLIQRGDTVAFYGTVQPEVQVADRLLASCIRKDGAELLKEARSTSERLAWQNECNLRTRFDHDGS